MLRLRLGSAGASPAVSGATPETSSVDAEELREGACAPQNGEGVFIDFDEIFSLRIREADDFYATKMACNLTDAERGVVRQAYAGLLWSKQFYHYVVKNWLTGDPDQPPPPPGHAASRNSDWTHLFSNDVLSMPDKWEYPWFAAWDLAFHMIPFARIDRDFAKSQLQLLLREWYMHPNGQIPAYECNFCDVNPPVHAWACWRAYKIGAPPGEARPPFPRADFSKTAAQFHLVGQSQGRAWQAHLFRRIPRPRQHRPL